MYRALEDQLWTIAQVEKASIFLTTIADDSDRSPSSKHANTNRCVGAYRLKLSKDMAGDDITGNVRISVQADAQQWAGSERCMDVHGTITGYRK